MFSSNSRPLPPRTHSINAVKHANYFASVDEELRDCKRVQRQGQEEDLREALSRMMARVEEMYETLKSSHQSTTDLETQLTLSESNLKLALANNEMLEDALKSGSLSKDVGWRRSVPSPVVVPPLPASHSQQMSTCIDENENEAQGGILPDLSDSPSSDRDSRAGSPAPAPAVASQTPSNDSRFFRFRFTGSGRSTPTLPPNSPPFQPKASRPGRTPSHPAVGHLTSASLPSLVGSPPPPTAPAPPVVNIELEELREQLLIEKRNSEKITREKSQLEAELENLSQALFEEANKMVKVERIKRAEAEDELKDVHAEKDALKAALRLIEEDRMRVENVHRQPHVNGIDGSRTNHSRTSSQEAIVSPRPRDSLTPPSSFSPPPSSLLPPEVAISAEQDSVVEDAPSSPAPLYVPPPHVEDSAPVSRTGSPMPLPHPHRLSHLRTGPAPPPAPAPPPPSAADGFPISPWADPPFGGGEEDGVNVDLDVDADLSIPPITLYSPPGEAEMGVPWGKW